MPTWWILLLLSGWLPAHAGCLLANPSFEVPGTVGDPLPGWTAQGAANVGGPAAHGLRALRLGGAGGAGEVSQELPAVEGSRWSLSAHVRVPDHTLSGTDLARARLLWLDAQGTELGGAEWTLADAGHPSGQIWTFQADSPSAPPACRTVRLALEWLPDPLAVPGAVLLDQLELLSDQEPTVEGCQWDDFPGGRRLEFSGRSWRVKGPGIYGPGPNLFCDSPSCVAVDEAGRLRLSVQPSVEGWTSSEVVLEEALGYGDYIFTSVGRLDQLDPHVVLGLFLWQYAPCWDAAAAWWNPYNEVDIEFSRWGQPGNAIAQYVAQPYDWAGNLVRFDADFAEGEVSSHAFCWEPDRVVYRSWRGGPEEESSAPAIAQWTYQGPHLPRPEQPRVHLNLWKLAGDPASAQEVVLSAFTFRPWEDPLAVPPTRDGRPLPEVFHLSAAPNPANGGTRLGFRLDRPGEVQLEVFRLDGSRIRRLAHGWMAAGTHQLAWDGRAEDGREAASGLYLVRLEQGGRQEVRRVALVR